MNFSIFSVKKERERERERERVKEREVFYKRGLY